MRTTRPAVLCAIATAALALVAAGVSGTSTCLLLVPGFQRASADSRACLGCHDGTAAGAVSLHASHPVERVYADAWMERRADLRAIPARELVLAKGLVTCATCHDGASSHPHHTAVPPEGLCRGCHDR